MSFRLTKSARFEASHVLPNHDGKCARLHGHSWQATVTVEGTTLQTSGPKAGMLEDFGDIGSALSRLVADRLDHYHLNDTTGLANPTSEALAEWIFYALKPSIPGLVAVKVEETCTSAAEYRHVG